MQDHIKDLAKQALAEGFDPKRFLRRGHTILFKSKIAIQKAGQDKHYNKWYAVAVIPEDLRTVIGIERAIARAFVQNGYQPLTEDQVRTEALNYVVAG